MNDEFNASFELLLKDETFRQGIGRVIESLTQMNETFAKLQGNFNFFSDAINKSFSGLNQTVASFAKNTKNSLGNITSKLNSFSNIDFSSSFKRQGDDIGIFFDEFGMKLDNNSYKLYRFRETALRSFSVLSRPIADFTKSAVEGSGSVQNRFARLSMFLDSSNVDKEFISKTNLKDPDGSLLHLIKRQEAASKIREDIMKFTLNNPLKNISYSDAVKSYGTFLSGNMDMSSALVGLDMLSHADKIFPEIARTDMTNYLVNSYNQMKGFYQIHGKKYGADNTVDIDPRVIMERTLNTMSMVSNKYKFNLDRGETPYKALSKSLTTNNLGAGFTLEELGVMAGTMTSAGVTASETDTAINNFLIRLARAKKRWGTEFKHKNGAEMDLVETLSHINFLSKSEHKDKDLRDVISDLMEVFTIRGSKSVAISIPNLGGMKTQIDSFTRENNKEVNPNNHFMTKKYEDNANLMNRTFAGSSKAFNTMVEDFQVGYGKIARGFKWMALDVGSTSIGFINQMRESNNIFAKVLGGGLTFSMGAAGSVLSIFSDMAPMIIALTGLYHNKGSLKGMFTDIGGGFKSMGRGLGSIIKGLFVLGRSNILVGLFLSLGSAVWGLGKGIFSVFSTALPSAIKMGTAGIVLFAKTTFTAFTGLAKVIPNLSKMFYLLFLGVGEQARTIYNEVSSKIIKMAAALVTSKAGVAGAAASALFLGLEYTGLFDSLKGILDGVLGKLSEFAGSIKEKLGIIGGTAKEGVLGVISYFGDLTGVGDLLVGDSQSAMKSLDDLKKRSETLFKNMGRSSEVYSLGYTRLASLSNLTSAVKIDFEKNLSEAVKLPSLEAGMKDIAYLKSSLDKGVGFLANIDRNVASILDKVGIEHDSGAELDLLETLRKSFLFGGGLDA
ncbi:MULTISPECIES: hypothetical protein [unclassified Borrelia]|uniref:hypothetical protein n=1 Tax=unclassified Borrelia TaxID=2649934 RepID=UPI001E4C98CF|nr:MULTISPECIES: hypothetical protein [unclassified Borrelia]UGQ16688.1 hypothetical protein LSO06_05055 [Borrelia sp. RT5S]UGQ17846.1 hypothetical protein LSO05_05290 [Borrelia sp. RT1S]